MSENFRNKLQNIVNRLEIEARPQGQQDIDHILSLGISSYSELLAAIQNEQISTETHQIICWIIAKLDCRQGVTALKALIQKSEPSTKRAAIQALGELNDRGSVPYLVDVLRGGESDEVRESAAYALGLIGDRQAFVPLSSILQDKNQNPNLRGMAAEALSDIRDNRAISYLIDALKDESVEVRFWSIFALGEMQASQAIPVLTELASSDRATVPGRGTVSEEASLAIQRITETDAAE